MTVWDLKEGQKGNIQSFCNNIPTPYVRRLEELGIFEDQRVECVKSLPFGGPKVIRIGSSVFSLSKELAQHICLVTQESL